MKNKLASIVLICFSLACLAFLLIAKQARKRSDAILEEFKTIDNSFKKSNDSLKKYNDSLQKGTSEKMIFVCPKFYF